MGEVAIPAALLPTLSEAATRLRAKKAVKVLIIITCSKDKNCEIKVPMKPSSRNLDVRGDEVDLYPNLRGVKRLLFYKNAQFYVTKICAVLALSSHFDGKYCISNIQERFLM